MHNFFTQHPVHLCHNRLPLMADTIFDFRETGLNAPNIPISTSHPLKQETLCLSRQMV